MKYVTRPLPVIAAGAVPRSKAAKSLLACSFLLFLTAQMAGLSHSHDGDLRLQGECDVCLKLSIDDEVAVNKILADAPFANSTSLNDFLPTWDQLAAPVARARAPPTV